MESVRVITAFRASEENFMGQLRVIQSDAPGEGAPREKATQREVKQRRGIDGVWGKRQTWQNKHTYSSAPGRDLTTGRRSHPVGRLWIRRSIARSCWRGRAIGPGGGERHQLRRDGERAR